MFSVPILLGHEASFCQNPSRPRQQRERRGRRLLRYVAGMDRSPSARLRLALTQQSAGLRIDQPHPPFVPLHVHAPADPTTWSAVVRGLDFDAAVEVDRALTVGERRNSFRGQSPQVLPRVMDRHRHDDAANAFLDRRTDSQQAQSQCPDRRAAFAGG